MMVVGTGRRRNYYYFWCEGQHICGPASPCSLDPFLSIFAILWCYVFGSVCLLVWYVCMYVHVLACVCVCVCSCGKW